MVRTLLGLYLQGWMVQVHGEESRCRAAPAKAVGDRPVGTKRTPKSQNPRALPCNFVNPGHLTS